VPDERVQAAIANWAPRFVSQGVDYNDFARVTAKVERWAEWLPAWVENGDMHAGLARETEALGRTRTAGEAWNRAALSYHFAKFVWMIDMERYRDAADKAVAALREVHRLLDPTAERVEIPFEGTSLVGNLRRPPGATEAERPLVVLLPGLDSTKEEFFSWENVFLQRGMATFSLDGSGSSDPNSQPLSYQWTQIDGPAAVIDDRSKVQPVVTAPNGEATLTFELKVTNASGKTDTDTVVVHVAAPK